MQPPTLAPGPCQGVRGKQKAKGVGSLLNKQSTGCTACVFRSWLFFSSFCFTFVFSIPSCCLPRRRDRRASSTSLLPLFVLGALCFALFALLASFSSFLWGAPLANHGPKTHCSLAAAPVAATRGTRIFTYWKNREKSF